MQLSKRSPKSGRRTPGLMASRGGGNADAQAKRLGGWRSSVMVERHAHLAPDQSREGRQARFATRWLRLATSEKKRGQSLDQPLDLLVGRAGIEPATNGLSAGF